jgi:hypothetical protein
MDLSNFVATQSQNGFGRVDADGFPLKKDHSNPIPFFPLPTIYPTKISILPSLILHKSRDGRFPPYESLDLWDDGMGRTAMSIRFDPPSRQKQDGSGRKKWQNQPKKRQS